MDKIEEIEIFAKENNIPIMEKDGINFLTSYIEKNNIKTILEIGSAIGYSAIKMALVDSNIKIISIERDHKRYLNAQKNVADLNLNNQITLINDDAFNIGIDEQFDLIFIDAAKSQYIKFFEKFKNNLNPNGVIVSDNMNFHGHVSNNTKQSRNLRQLMNKLKKYIEFLKDNQEFKTEFVEVGDKIAISRRV